MGQGQLGQEQAAAVGDQAHQPVFDDPDDQRTLADLIRPKHRQDREEALSTRREALAAVVRHLRHVAARRPLRVKNLQRDATVELGIVRGVDRPHPTPPQQPDKGVTPSFGEVTWLVGPHGMAHDQNTTPLMVAQLTSMSKRGS